MYKNMSLLSDQVFENNLKNQKFNKREWHQGKPKLLNLTGQFYLRSSMRTSQTERNRIEGGISK